MQTQCIESSKHVRYDSSAIEEHGQRHATLMTQLQYGRFVPMHFLFCVLSLDVKCFCVCALMPVSAT